MNGVLGTTVEFCVADRVRGRESMPAVPGQCGRCSEEGDVSLGILYQQTI